MAQQARDEAGNIWEVDAQGNPVRLIQPAGAGSPSTTVQPSGWRLQQQQAEAARQAAADRRAEASAADARAKAEREAREWAATHNPDGSPKPVANTNGSAELTAATRANAINAFTATRQLDTLIADIEKRFKDGPGSTKGIAGGLDWLPTPSNRQFDAAGNAVRGAAITALGFTSGQTNSPKEVEMNIGPYIPAAGDYDAVIKDKIARLKDLRDRARVQAATVLGGVPDASGSIVPLERLSRQDRDKLFPPGTMQPFASDPKEVRSLNPSDVVRELAGANAKSIDLDAMGDAVVTYGDGSTRTIPLNDDQRNSEWYAQIYREKRGEDPPLAATVTDDGGTGGGGGGSSPPSGPDRTSWQSGVDALVRGAADVPSFGLADEAEAGLESLITGRPFSEMLRGQEAIDNADQQQNPYLRLTGQIAGGVPVAYGLGRVGAAALPSRPGLGVIGAETAGGGLYGAGASNEDRLTGTAIGAVSSAVGNQIGQRVLSPVARGIFGSGAAQSVANAGRRVLGREPAFRPPTPSRAENMVLKVGEDQTVDQIRGTLDDAVRLGLPMSLADANPQLRMLAGSASRLSPKVREQFEPMLGRRARGQGERAIDAITRDLGPGTNMIEARNALRQQARSDSEPFYREAFSRSAPVDPEIQGMLNTPAGRDALNRAVSIARNEGVDPNGLGFDLNDAGEVVGIRAPTFETLHMVKRGLDSVVEGSRGATGVLNRDDPAIAAVDNLRKRFRGRLGDLDQNYRAGNAAYSAQMRNRDALNFGYDATRTAVKPDVLADAASRMPGDPLRQGFRTGLIEQVEATPFSSNPYDRIAGSPDRVEKLTSLFPEGAPSLLRQADLEQQMAKTGYEVIGGSPTASRRAADEGFAPGLGAQFVGEAGLGMLTGTPPIASTTSAARRLLGDRMRMGFGGKRAEEIGNMLLEANPATGISVLDDMVARRAAYDRWKSGYNTSLGVFGSSLALPTVGFAN